MLFGLVRKTLILWQIRAFALCMLVILSVLPFLSYSVYLLIPAAVLAISGIIVAFWYLPRFFKKYKIFVGEKSVVVTRGVFVETSHIMPFKRLVFAGGYSTPLARAFGLKGITLRAARASVIIPEIEDFAADKLIFALSGEKSND